MKKSLRCWFQRVAWCGAAAVQMVALGEVPPDPYQDRFTAMSGRELAFQLTDRDSCGRAFYELHRRNARSEAHWESLLGPDEGYEIFIRDHPAPRVTVCPQSGGAAPLYLVAYNRRGHDRSSLLHEDEPPPLPRAHELFPPLPEYRQPLPDDTCRAFYTIKSDGQFATVFMPVGFSPGDVGDLTGDGVLEYLHLETYGVGGEHPPNANLLQVATIEDPSRCLLTLLLNWGADEWTFRVRDTDGDRRAEIEIGPRLATGIEARAVFRWDEQAQVFRGPPAGENDHFRVLKSDADYWPKLNELAAAGLRFPAEPAAVPAGEDAPSRARWKETRWEDFPTRLPADFWALAPKEAALAFAESNRTQDHRNRFRIALEDRDGALPPESGTVMLTDGSQGCIGSGGGEWFLRFDPRESYLVTARSIGGQSLLDGSSLTLHWQVLPYADAHQIAAVIWWLDRLRVHPPAPPTIGMSTHTHSRWIALRDGDGRAVLQRAEVCSFTVWFDAFTRKLHLEASSWLMEAGWSGRHGPLKSPSQLHQEQRLATKATPQVAGQIIEHWDPGAGRISHRLAAAAVQVLRSSDSVPVEKWRAMLAQVPPSETPRGRTSEQITADLRAVEDEHFRTRHRDRETSGSLESPETIRIRERYRALVEEAERTRIQDGADHPNVLRDALESALSRTAPDGDAASLRK